jgi:hypothetical protein
MRMLSAVTILSIARIRPSTPCFEAEYCGALFKPTHDAASIGSAELGDNKLVSYAPTEPVRTIAFHELGARLRLT